MAMAANFVRASAPLANKWLDLAVIKCPLLGARVA